MNPRMLWIEELAKNGIGRHRWLVTGAAGFIGSHLVEALLYLDQQVTGLDNFSNGRQSNLDEIRASVGSDRWARFHMERGDIRDPVVCGKACDGARFILHQAAAGSVPRSIEDPAASHENNVTGFINVLCAAKAAGARRFVYASSASVYGDSEERVNSEETLGRCLSPYAATKRVNELYADVFSRCYGLECVGLRYFNVFGPRQNTQGAYVNVIPKWVAAMMRGEQVCINGDGETSRDYCYISNVVQANLRAALMDDRSAVNDVYNVATGVPTTLNQLFPMLRDRLLSHYPHLETSRAEFRDFREGDSRFSCGDIEKARTRLGYNPDCGIEEGLDETVKWFRANLA